MDEYPERIRDVLADPQRTTDARARLAHWLLLDVATRFSGSLPCVLCAWPAADGAASVPLCAACGSALFAAHKALRARTGADTWVGTHLGRLIAVLGAEG